MTKPYETGVSACGRYVFVRAFQEPLSISLISAFTAEVLSLYREQGAAAFLVDARGTVCAASVSETYDYAYLGAEQRQAPRAARIAMVHDPGSDAFRFFETVMRNAGYNARLFVSHEEAAGWAAE